MFKRKFDDNEDTSSSDSEERLVIVDEQLQPVQPDPVPELLPEPIPVPELVAEPIPEPSELLLPDLIPDPSQPLETTNPDEQAANILMSFSKNQRQQQPSSPLLLRWQRSILSREWPTSSKQRPTTSQQRPISQKRPGISQQRPTTSQRQPTITHQRPTSLKQWATISQERPTSPQRRPTTSQELPITSQRRPISSPERLTSSLERPIPSRQRPTSPKQQPTSSRQRPSSSPEQPILSRLRPKSSLWPTLSRQRSTSSPKCPTTSQQQPTSLQELPTLPPWLSSSKQSIAPPPPSMPLTCQRPTPAPLTTSPQQLAIPTPSSRSKSSLQRPTSSPERPISSPVRSISSQKQSTSSRQRPKSSRKGPASSPERPKLSRLRPKSSLQWPASSRQWPISSPKRHTSTQKEPKSLPLPQIPLPQQTTAPLPPSVPLSRQRPTPAPLTTTPKQSGTPPSSSLPSANSYTPSQFQLSKAKSPDYSLQFSPDPFSPVSYKLASSPESYDLEPSISQPISPKEPTSPEPLALDPLDVEHTAPEALSAICFLSDPSDAVPFISEPFNVEHYVQEIALEHIISEPLAAEQNASEPLVLENINLESMVSPDFTPESLGSGYSVPEPSPVLHINPEPCVAEQNASEPLVLENITLESMVSPDFIPESLGSGYSVPEPSPVLHINPEPCVIGSLNTGTYGPRSFPPEFFMQQLLSDSTSLPYYGYTLHATNIYIVTDENTEPIYQVASNDTPAMQQTINPQMCIVNSNFEAHPVPSDAQYRLVEPRTVPLVFETMPMPNSQMAPSLFSQQPPQEQASSSSSMQEPTMMQAPMSPQVSTSTNMSSLLQLAWSNQPPRLMQESTSVHSNIPMQQVAPPITSRPKNKSKSQAVPGEERLSAPRNATNINVLTNENTEPIYLAASNDTPAVQYTINPQMYIVNSNFEAHPAPSDAQYWLVDPTTTPFVFGTMLMPISQMVPSTSSQQPSQEQALSSSSMQEPMIMQAPILPQASTSTHMSSSMQPAWSNQPPRSLPMTTPMHSSIPMQQVASPTTRQSKKNSKIKSQADPGEERQSAPRNATNMNILTDENAEPIYLAASNDTPAVQYTVSPQMHIVNSNFEAHPAPSDAQYWLVDPTTTPLVFEKMLTPISQMVPSTSSQQPSQEQELTSSSMQEPMTMQASMLLQASTATHMSSSMQPAWSNQPPSLPMTTPMHSPIPMQQVAPPTTRQSKKNSKKKPQADPGEESQPTLRNETNINILIDENAEPIYPAASNNTPSVQYTLNHLRIFNSNLGDQPVLLDAQYRSVEPKPIPYVFQTMLMPISQMAPALSIQQPPQVLSSSSSSMQEPMMMQKPMTTHACTSTQSSPLIQTSCTKEMLRLKQESTPIHSPQGAKPTPRQPKNQINIARRSTTKYIKAEL